MGLDVQGQAEELASALNARFRPALMAFFLRRIGNHAVAEDLTQDVLVRVTKHGAQIDASRPDAYVFQIAANLLRDRGRRYVVRSNYLQSFEAASAADMEERDPERVLQARQSLATVMRAVRELPERTRTVFILFRLEGMKQRENRRPPRPVGADGGVARHSGRAPTYAICSRVTNEPRRSPD